MLWTKLEKWLKMENLLFYTQLKLKEFLPQLKTRSFCAVCSVKNTHTHTLEELSTLGRAFALDFCAEHWHFLQPSRILNLYSSRLGWGNQKALGEVWGRESTQELLKQEVWLWLPGDFPVIKAGLHQLLAPVPGDSAIQRNFFPSAFRCKTFSDAFS